jgi:hypothetical protein
MDGLGPRVLRGWPGAASPAWAGVGMWGAAGGRLAAGLLAPFPGVFAVMVGGVLGRGLGPLGAGASTATLLFGGRPV